MSVPRHHGPESIPAEVTAGLYDELRRIAHRAFAGERSDHTLQPTAAVNEACLRLLTTSRLPEASGAERLALAARVLRQVLIDHHRQKDALKRGGGMLRVDLDPERPAAEATMVEFDSIHAALESLRALHERQAQVLELRIFGGLSVEQVAEALGVSRRTVEADWTVARAFLRRELSRGARV